MTAKQQGYIQVEHICLPTCFCKYDLQKSNKTKEFVVFSHIACRQQLEETSIPGLSQSRVSHCANMKAKASHHT